MTEATPPTVGIRALADLATPMAIRVAATLRVADHLAGRPSTAAAIAAAVGAHAGALDRLLRHLTAVGLLVCDDAGRYRTTALGDQLREDHPAGRRKWLDGEGAIGRGDLCFVDLMHSVRTGEPSYPVRYGRSFWDDLAGDPGLSDSFDELMSHHVELDHPAVADAYEWPRLATVVDVGGGSGALLGMLLTRHPTLSGTLVDLPGPAEAARRRFAGSGLADRGDVLVGSFFDPLPAGAGGYLLSAVLHDWDDDDAVAILARCAEAAAAAGRVLVIEAISTVGSAVSTAMDLRMLAYYGGRERDLGELAELGARAGLAVRSVHPAGYLSIIEFAAASAGG